ADLPRDVRDGPVPDRVSTRPRSLGQRAVAAGVARDRGRPGAGRAAVVAAVAGRGTDAAAVVRRGRCPGVPGQTAARVRRPRLAAGGRGDELRPAAGPFVAALPDLAVRLPDAWRRLARSGAGAARVASPQWRDHGRILERTGPRPRRVA